MLRKYKDGTKFEDIVELYYFDESLRQLFLRYLIKVENEIKSQVSYYFTERNGENQKEYLKKHDSISEQELYERMGFPENWRNITRYRRR